MRQTRKDQLKRSSHHGCSKSDERWSSSSRFRGRRSLWLQLEQSEQGGALPSWPGYSVCEASVVRDVVTASGTRIMRTAGQDC